MDNIHSNMNPKLQEAATTSHIEHENVSRVGVVNAIVTLDNVITNNVDNKQLDATNNLGERKPCSWTNLTGCCSDYVYFQLREFVNTDGFHLRFQSIHAFSKQEVQMLYVAKNTVSKKTIDD